MDLKSKSLNNGNKAGQLAEGSELESDPSLVGTGKFADNVADDAKQWPTYGTSDKSTNMKDMAFKRVSSGF